MNINEIKWWHTMDLGALGVTNGRNNPAEHLPKLHLPDDLTGKFVLDIGCWDGFYTFACAKRGAQVMATDSYVWRHPNIGRHGFDFALAAQPQEVRDRIEAYEVDIMELQPNPLMPEFDVVLMLGVLYHMKHPLLALERAFAMVAKGGTLVLETAIDALDVKRPAMIFYEGRELNNDPSNWVGPNPAAVLAMCRVAGFKEARIAHQDARLVVHATKE